MKVIIGLWNAYRTLQRDFYKSERSLDLWLHLALTPEDGAIRVYPTLSFR